MGVILLLFDNARWKELYYTNCSLLSEEKWNSYRHPNHVPIGILYFTLGMIFEVKTESERDPRTLVLMGPGSRTQGSHLDFGPKDLIWVPDPRKLGPHGVGPGTQGPNWDPEPILGL
jgi:hypothetical protein